MKNTLHRLSAGILVGTALTIAAPAIVLVAPSIATADLPSPPDIKPAKEDAPAPDAKNDAKAAPDEKADDKKADDEKADDEKADDEKAGDKKADGKKAGDKKSGDKKSGDKKGCSVSADASTAGSVIALAFAAFAGFMLRRR